MAGATVQAAEALRQQVRGEILEQADPGYDAARTVWNAMVDRRPALVVRPVGAADVVAAVNVARDFGLFPSIKGGGHNVAGKAVGDDALLIDCSLMRAVTVDPARQLVHVQPGALLADLDHESQAFGLVVPTGVVSQTGVAGLALGGGFGWLSRRYGMTIDHIEAVDLVTADGRLVHVSLDQHPDLLWGIRGGGGNFGVVTSFTFRAHRLGPQILAGRVTYAAEDADDVLKGWRDRMADAPDAVGSLAGFAHLPADPMLPPELADRRVLSITLTYAGEVDDGIDALAGLRELATPLADTVEPRPFTQLQQMSDEKYRPRYRVYAKSGFLKSLPDDAIDLIAAMVDPLPNTSTSVSLIALGGAVGRVDPSATAFPHRDIAFEFSAQAMWMDPQEDEGLRSWARSIHATIEPYATGGVYSNLPSEDQVAAAYGQNLDRLARLKADWDPGNLFRFCQNVEPAR